MGTVLSCILHFSLLRTIGQPSTPLYANVAPKAPVARNKSFTLNTSSGPDSPSPTSPYPTHDNRTDSHDNRTNSPPHYEVFSPEETDDDAVYTAISHSTREPRESEGCGFNTMPLGCIKFGPVQI